MSHASGMTVFCFGGRACASFEIALPCFRNVHIPDAATLFSEASRVNILVMMWLLCLFEVFLVIALHCPNMRSSSSALRR